MYQGRGWSSTSTAEQRTSDVRTDFFSARVLDEWNANPSKKNGEEVLETVQGPQSP
jgi:hypothetical protein